MDVRLPDGRVVRNVPEGVTKSQLMAKLSKHDSVVPMPPNPDVPAAPEVSRGPQINPALRGAGMAARTAVGAATSLLDAPRLLTDPVNKVVANLASKAGNAALAEGARDAYNTPYISDTAKGVIDDFTGGALKPKTSAEKVVNTAGEIGLSMAGGSLINKLASNKTASAAKKAIPNAEELRQQASNLYSKADQTGGILKPQTTDKFLNEAMSRVSPKTRAGQLLSGEGPADKVIAKLQGIKGRTLSLAEAQEVDEFLGNSIDDLTELGKPTKEGLKLIKIQDALRQTISGASANDIVGTKEGFKALNDGRKAWSQYNKMRDVERIISRAQNMEQPVTALKNGFNGLLNNPNRMRGFNAQERAAIAKAAKVGAITDILKTMGSRLNPVITTGVLSGGGAMAAGLPGGALGLAASYGASTGARAAANALQMGKAKNVQRAIAGIPKSEMKIPTVPLYGLLPFIGDEP